MFLQEVFSFNVGRIPESQFLTIVCYSPINPKIRFHGEPLFSTLGTQVPPTTGKSSVKSP